MSVCKILKMGDPRLLEVAEMVTNFDSDELHMLVSDLIDTMRAENGAGLAAPQIGINLQVVIFGSGDTNSRYPDAPVIPKTVLINPVITPLGNDLKSNVNSPLFSDWEGCLSVPGMRGMVPRYQHIHYSGRDVYGDQIERTVSDFHARVVQHECDHLFGILYPMRMSDLSRFGYIDTLFPGQDLPSED